MLPHRPRGYHLTADEWNTVVDASNILEGVSGEGVSKLASLVLLRRKAPFAQEPQAEQILAKNMSGETAPIHGLCRWWCSAQGTIHWFNWAYPGDGRQFSTVHVHQWFGILLEACEPGEWARIAVAGGLYPVLSLNGPYHTGAPTSLVASDTHWYAAPAVYPGTNRRRDAWFARLIPASAWDETTELVDAIFITDDPLPYPFESMAEICTNLREGGETEWSRRALKKVLMTLMTADEQYMHLGFDEKGRLFYAIKTATDELPLKWRCTGTPDYLCVQDDPLGWDTEEECLANCFEEEVRWSCSGPPWYHCYEDPEGIYATEEDCYAGECATTAPPPPPPPPEPPVVLPTEPPSSSTPPPGWPDDYPLIAWTQGWTNPIEVCVGENVPNQYLRVWNAHVSTLNYMVHLVSTAWVHFSYGFSTEHGTSDGPGDWTDHELIFDTDELEIGDYEVALSIIGNASNSPVVLAVKVSVMYCPTTTPPPPPECPEFCHSCNDAYHFHEGEGGTAWRLGEEGEGACAWSGDSLTDLYCVAGRWGCWAFFGPEIGGGSYSKDASPCPGGTYTKDDPEFGGPATIALHAGPWH